MMNFAELASVPPPILLCCSLTSCGWQWLLTWPVSRAPPASAPNPTCAPSSPGALSAAWTRCPRARKNLDRHPNYILAAYMASGT